jgi:putative DNA primase/helicase
VSNLLNDAIDEALNTDPENPETVWDDPEPLITVPRAKPYQIESLPATIRAAVNEVQKATQAPVSLIAGCALSSISLAAQGAFDVRRANHLTGPVSLFLMTLAESGERKTTVDGFFMKAIRAFETDEARAMKPEREACEAAMKAWQAECDGIRDKIRAEAKKGSVSPDLVKRLKDHEVLKPVPPRESRVLYHDATIEALTYGLSKNRPSAGVILSEAGTFFGSHAAGKDSFMRTLSQFNQCWEGADMAFDRRSGESYTVRGARLTVSFQVQAQTLKTFFDQRDNGLLARKSGFLARFLVAWPASTQGTRLFQEAPDDMPALSAFNGRVLELLRKPLSMDSNGRLTPEVLDLSPEAFVVWRDFYNELERELREDGELEYVRDVASKTADNAARLAGLFHTFEGDTGNISAERMRSGCDLALWYLSESLRFFGGLALSPEIADAARLERWLLTKGALNIPTREAIQYGPIREAEKLTAVVNYLSGLNRARIVLDGKRRLIYINPLLTSGMEAGYGHF